MSWGTPGVTVKRRIIDQSVTIPSVVNNVQTAPFQSLKTFGYHRGIWLSIPQNTGVTALGGGTLVLSTGAQLKQLRAIKHFRLTLQGTAPIYDVEGIDLGFLAYCRNGSVQQDRSYAAGLSVVGANPTTDQYPFNWPTRDNALLGLTTSYAPYLRYEAGATATTLCYGMWIPATEIYKFRNVPMPTASGKDAVLMDQELELGMVMMQNSSSNLLPQVDIASAYGPDQTSMLVATGAATNTLTNLNVIIENEYYDVPASPADQPSAFQLAWLVQRTAADYAVSGQAVTIPFKAAGLLTKIIYVAYNDTTTYGTLVDLTSTATCQLVLSSGATMIKYSENATQNALRSFWRYNAAPPGILIHDLTDDGTLTQDYDTANLVSIQTAITGLPSSVTRLHVIQERLIPVTA